MEPDDRAHASSPDAIAGATLELGAEAGPLGFPVADERYLRDSPFKRFGSPPRVEVAFERGTLSYDERSGTVWQSA